MVNKKAVKEVSKQLEEGKELTFEMVGAVFGQDFWMMLVMAFMDSQDAARAIQNAINRLRTEEKVN